MAGPAHADSGDRWDAGTMGLQAGAGVASGAVGSVVGGLVGGLISLAAGKSDFEPLFTGVTVGVMVGGFAGILVGIQLAGDAREGTGRWYGTLGGAVIGVGGAGLLARYSDTLRGRYEIPTAVAFIVLLTVPAIVGYQLSADEHPPVMATPLTLTF